MASCCLLLRILFVHFLPLCAQDLLHTDENLALVQHVGTKSRFSDIEVKTQRPNVVSIRGHTLSQHSQLHLKHVHGILILVGWGTLLPIGAIIARFSREEPLKYYCNRWLICHTVCQTTGYIAGTTGWCIGIWLGSVSKNYLSKMQRALSIIAFTIINVQMVSISLRPSKEASYRKWWNIWHQGVGYLTIGMVVAMIYAGISNEREADKLRLVYVGIIGVLLLVAVPLQVLKWKSIINQQFLRMASSIRSAQGI